MRAKMPKDLEALLFQLENADDIKKVQDEWAEYQAANENYEKNYPVQFANLVEANLKFKENKSIPTPAEQMQDFKERIKTRIDDLLEEKQHHDTYELEEANDNINQREAEYLQQSKELKLTFDTQTPVASKQETAKSKSGHDIDKSQELGISWLKQHQQQEEKQHKQEEKTEGKEQDIKGYDFKLIFANMNQSDKLENLDLSKDELEKEDLDLEYE
ncbi:MAG: hypothetical protein BGO69_10800 [Bacteroidetes bacterium 46-16]|nr:MAG: hypothetical protein BGO69_10800 [Bacteroidetes bacterium 46-16]